MNIERRDPKRFVDPPSVPNAGASPNGPCIIFISDSEENKILHFSLAPSRSSSDCLILRSITLTRARQQLKIQNEKRTVAWSQMPRPVPNKYHFWHILYESATLSSAQPQKGRKQSSIFLWRRKGFLTLSRPIISGKKHSGPNSFCADPFTFRSLPDRSDFYVGNRWGGKNRSGVSELLNRYCRTSLRQWIEWIN